VVVVVVARATEGDEILEPLLGVILIGSVMNVEFTAISPAQAAAIFVSAVDLVLEYAHSFVCRRSA